MIIFAKANGEVIKTEPSPIYQGSSLKGSLYLVAPFPNSNGVTVQFQLPNGNVTKPYPMTPTGEINGLKLDNTEMSIWVWDVKNAMVTAIPGVVGVTIKVIYGNNEDYEVTTINTSFNVEKGVPNALPLQEPSANEWNAIISALNSIGSKVTKPLMTNFTYDPTSGESVKQFNSGMTMTENFPSVYPEGATEYNGFAVVEFYENDWQEQGENDYILYVPYPTVDLGDTSTPEFEISVYELTSTGFTKRYPNINIGLAESNPDISIDATIPYEGVVLITKKASLITPILLDEINEATANANTATTRANTIAHTLETAYDNGDFKGEQGEQGIQGPQGPIGPQGPRGVGVPEGGTEGQILTKTASGTAWENAKGGGSSGQWLNPMNIDFWDAYGGQHYGVLVPKGYTRYLFYLGEMSQEGIVQFSTNEMLDRNTQYWMSGRGMTYTPDNYYSTSGNPYNNENFIFFEYNLYGSDTDYSSFNEVPYVKMEV